MKNVKIFSMLLGALLCTSVSFSSCSESKETEQSPVSLQEQEMQELIQYAKDTAPLVSPMNPESRGFWKNLVNWFKGIGTSDAAGAGWARGHGASWGQALRISVTTSLVYASSREDELELRWNINNQWWVYSTSTFRDHEKIGNEHNHAISEILKENPSIKKGSLSDSQILTIVDKKVKSFGNNENLSPLQRAELLTLLTDLKRAKTPLAVQNAFLTNMNGYRSEMQFLSTYLDGVLATDNPSLSKDYTEGIYDKIDALTSVNKTSLKYMVSIALCSINLWGPK